VVRLVAALVPAARVGGHERVARDVWNTKITAAYAHDHHKVVVDAETGTLDAAATEALRAKA